MKTSSFEKVKDLANQIEANTQGDAISNPLGTGTVYSPMEGGIADFNRGIDVMTNFGHYHVPE